MEKMSRRSSGGMRVAIAVGSLKESEGDWVDDEESSFEFMRQSRKRRRRIRGDEESRNEWKGIGIGVLVSV